MAVEEPAPVSVHPIEERLEHLAALREQALHAGSDAAVERQHRAREAHRTRAHRPPARSRLVRRARHARPSPGPRLRDRGHASAHRRRGHRVGHRRRPQGLPLQPGLHRVRRRARRGVRREDPQGDGPRRIGRRADDRPQRRRRRPHPGRRRLARRLRRHLLPQREGVGRDPADQRDPRPVRRRRGLLARAHRLRGDGQGHVAHVHHRSRRREDGHRRGRHAGGARRRAHPRVEVGRGGVRLRRRAHRAGPGSLPVVLPPGEQPRGPALLRVRRPGRPFVRRHRRPHPRRAQQAVRHEEGDRRGRRRRRVPRGQRALGRQHRVRLRAHRRPRRRHRRATSRRTSPARSTSTRRRRRRGSCAPATRSTCRW